MCVEQPELSGVMKSPARIATSGTLQRQAAQIAQEALALERLAGLPHCKAHPPRLLDTAPEYTRGTANFFMVSESAPGSDMAEILAESRQSGKPFNRRVIISVLDALFDLFARAHRAGVLWNDVKLDHIYWHHPTGQVSVIDWGNAVFLDEEPDKFRRALPRWEDYRQLVDSLGGFLQQSAPELYADLGWNEFQGEELDSARVSILARRIAYQQQVIALRVMEFQSLIKVVLSADPSLEGLQKIQSYQKVLNQIGAPWEADAVLEYSRALVLSSLAEGDTQSGVKAATQIWNLFNSNLDLPWHLLREYFRYPGLISDPLLPELAGHTLHEHWSLALWALITIAEKSDPSEWWERLMPVLRQKTIGTATPPPYQTSISLLTWLDAQEAQWQPQAATLRIILENWRAKGIQPGESPFDYAITDFIQSESGIPPQIRTELKQSYAAGKEAIQELFQSWSNMDWDSLPKAFRRAAGWDPDRWGIIRLARTVTAFQNWLDSLYQGPEEDVAAAHYLQEMIRQRPPVDRLLGSPAWLNALLRMLEAMLEGTPVTAYQAEVQAWCPWLLRYSDIHSDELQPEPTEPAIVRKVLPHFVSHLKAWSDLEGGLTAVQTRSPEYFKVCQRLAAGFQQVFSLNQDPRKILESEDNESHPFLLNAHESLQKLIAWREQVDAGNIHSAAACLRDTPIKGYLIIAHTLEKTELWMKQIIPLLQALMDQPPNDDLIKAYDDKSILGQLAKSWLELHHVWATLYETGLHQNLLEALEELIEEIRSSFHEWRQSIERSNDPVDLLLYHSQMKVIREISNKSIALSEQSRQARLNFASLGKQNEVALPVQMQKAQNVLYHLGKVEVLLTPELDQRFPGWSQDFQSILNVDPTQHPQEIHPTLPEDHPLFTWLVESDLA